MDLAIPSFLKRDQYPPAVVSRVREQKKTRTDKILLHLQDEVPQIGSGFRYVRIIRQGPKWISLQTAGVSKTIRLPIKKWNSLKQTETRTMSLESMTGEYNALMIQLGRKPIKKLESTKVGLERISKARGELALQREEAPRKAAKNDSRQVKAAEVNPCRVGTEAHRHFIVLQKGGTITDYLNHFSGKIAIRNARLYLSGFVRRGNVVLSDGTTA